MSKRSRLGRRQTANGSATRNRIPFFGGRGAVIVALVLGLSMLVTGGMVARRERLAKSATAGATGSPTPFDPGNPSKEYIYAGGRLIATEEPNGGGGTL